MERLWLPSPTGRAVKVLGGLQFPPRETHGIVGGQIHLEGTAVPASSCHSPIWAVRCHGRGIRASELQSSPRGRRAKPAQGTGTDLFALPGVEAGHTGRVFPPPRQQTFPASP